MKRELEQVEGPVLVLVAHPDDEAIGCGAMLQRLEKPLVVFATDGAPRNLNLWGNSSRRPSSRDDYAKMRRDEAIQALGLIGLEPLEFLEIADQELHLHLESAFGRLQQIAESAKLKGILSLAYEGGHPDHDSCCFLASMLAEDCELPAWEMPLYHRAGRRFVTQEFLNPTDDTLTLIPTALEEEQKTKMLAAYSSQEETLSQFTRREEMFRPLRKYFFSQPPHFGELNYESWGWPMKGTDLCAAFCAMQSSLQIRGNPVGVSQ
jgi:LmbE family N-acetylglucosaminyl deacetylase